MFAHVRGDAPLFGLAGLVLVSEAGGQCSDFLKDQGLTEGNPLLVAAPQLYPALARMIGPSLNG